MMPVASLKGYHAVGLRSISEYRITADASRVPDIRDLLASRYPDPEDPLHSIARSTVSDIEMLRKIDPAAYRSRRYTLCPSFTKSLF